MTQTQIDITKLSAEQIASIQTQVKEQSQQRTENFVSSVLPLCKGKEVSTSSNGNPMIKVYVNFTNSQGNRIFGNLFVMNKKSPSSLKALTV